MSAFLRLSDFEWASAARYLQYVSVRAGLVEFSLDQCHNFRVSGRSDNGPTKEGFRRLHRKKVALRKVVTENNASLERWVANRQEGGQRLEPEELAVIRAFYNQNKGLISLLGEHIAKAQAMLELWVTTDCMIENWERGEKEDDYPF